MKVLDMLYDLLLEPVILIGLLVMVGYLLQKAGAVKTITGTIATMVGITMTIFGGSQFSAIFKPITEAVFKSFGIQGYIMDSYAMRATATEALGDKLALMGYVFMIAFAVNLILVYFGKFTKAKGILLTGNAGTAHSTAMLWLVVTWLGLSDWASMLIAGVLVGLYWAYSSTLAVGVVDEITDGGGFTIGHNVQFGIWFFGKIARFFGKKEQDAEKLELPGWLGIFNNNVTSVAVLMMVFVGLFMAPLGIEGIETVSGGKNWLVYILLTGINFSMYMVILTTGVRLMVGEIVNAFKGIQEKLVPNAIPAIDIAAILPFSPNAATLGFMLTTLFTGLLMFALQAFKSPIVLIPSFIPLFFSGGAVGVVANKYGGIKSIVVCTLLLSLIQVFGTMWAISLMNYPQGVGWSGMFDFATVIPAVTQVLKWIGGLIH